MLVSRWNRNSTSFAAARIVSALHQCQIARLFASDAVTMYTLVHISWCRRINNNATSPFAWWIEERRPFTGRHTSRNEVAIHSCLFIRFFLYNIHMPLYISVSCILPLFTIIYRSTVSIIYRWCSTIRDRLITELSVKSVKITVLGYLVVARGETIHTFLEKLIFIIIQIEIEIEIEFYILVAVYFHTYIIRYI